MLFLFLVVCHVNAYIKELGRFGHSLVQLPNGSALIFGGHDWTGTDVFSHVVHGLKSDMWLMEQTSSLRITYTPVTYFGQEVPPARYHHTAFYHSPTDQLIIFGGSTHLRWYGTRTSSLFMCGREDAWSFSLQNQTWQQISPQLTLCAGSSTTFFSLLLVTLVLVSSIL